MAEAQAYVPFTLSDLAQAISKFRSDNEHSRDLESRFLVRELELIAQLTNALRSNVRDPGLVARLDEFRILELQAQRDKQVSDLAKLDREIEAIRRNHRHEAA